MASALRVASVVCLSALQKLSQRDLKVGKVSATADTRCATGKFEASVAVSFNVDAGRNGATAEAPVLASVVSHNSVYITSIFAVVCCPCRDLYVHSILVRNSGA